MVECGKYMVDGKGGPIYQSLYDMIPQDDIFLQYRLQGNLLDVSNETFFLAHENGKGLSRIWMSYGKQENAVSNWGAVYTQEEARGRGICRLLLDYCFDEIDKMENPPSALFCTAGDIARVYKRYGFVPAIKGADQGPLYRPMGDSPATFQEFCEKYYTPADELYIVPGTFGWRNEIDCLLRFALVDMGKNLEINGITNFWPIVLYEPERGKVLLTKDNKCVGWMVDDTMQLHPAYAHVTRFLTQE